MGCSSSSSVIVNETVNRIDSDSNAVKLKAFEDIKDAEWILEYLGDDFELEITNYKLNGQKFKPEGEIKFVYIFEHALGRSLIDKNDLYPFITNLGGIVYACDHVGHGKSDGPKYSCTIEEIREEIKNIIIYAKKEYPQLPIIIHGHSLGGLSLLSYILRNKENILNEISVCILESPWISNSPSFKVGCGSKCVVGCLDCTCQNCVLTRGKKRVPETFEDGEDDPKWIKVKNECKYYSTSVTGRLLNSVFDEIDYVNKNYKEYNENLPLLFIQGILDTMVSAEENIAYCQNLINTFPKANIILKTFELGTHNILKSKERKNGIEVFTSFIKKEFKLETKTESKIE